MKRINSIFGLCTLFAASSLLFSCSSDDDHGGTTPPTSNQKYVVMTLSERVVGNKAGFVSAYDDLPTGTIDNIGEKSLQGSNMGGFIAYKNALYKIYSTEDNANGIEKIEVQPDGKVYTAGFLQTGQGKPGSGNFVIVDDHSGFYWDMDEPYKLQKFNPETLARTGSIDMTAAINERGENESAIKFRSIGRKFLAVKEGKLYADLNYASTEGGQQGFWDDFYPDVYIAVIDIATGAHEKTIKVENTGSIGYVNENRMYNFDSNGDLYFITQGRSAIGGQSKISRIRANSTDIDATWSLNYSDLNSSDEGKFTGVFLDEGMLIVCANTEPLTGGPNGNINTEDVWKLYRVDINAKQFSEIQGIPAARNQGAAELAVKIDGKIYLRVGTNSGDVNGYFEYDRASNTTSQTFGIDVGGLVSGFHKVTFE